MKRLNLHLGAIILAFGAIAVPVQAHPPFAVAPVNGFEQDRADILAMAGTYRVTFDMQESTRWDPGYTPLDKKKSGGHEVVRVIEDSGRRIVLQHMLVAEIDGKTHVIKHWRQDWEYEPTRVLVYADLNSWKWEDVPAAMRTGRWSQTVWQVDDSPRYGGLGQFTTQAGVRRWQSDRTWRPLARRDAVRSPVYDRYLSVNRHQTGPDGWIHWQDNTKISSKDGRLTPVVQEYVLNTYQRFADYNVKAADEYWAATKDYWAAVRAEWARIAEEKGGIGIKEEADTGTVISGRLMQLADDINSKKTTTAKAIGAAQRLIRENTRIL